MCLSLSKGNEKSRLMRDVTGGSSLECGNTALFV